MKLTKLLILLISSTVAAVSISTVNAAEVRSISREIVKKVNGKPVASVRVSCAEIAQPRLIQQRGRSGPWCSAELPTECSKQKVKAAKKVCGTHFSKAVSEYIASQKSTPKADSTTLANGPEIDIAAVEVPLADTPGVEVEEDELEKRYEEFVESIDF